MLSKQNYDSIDDFIRMMQYTLNKWKLIAFVLCRKCASLVPGKMELKNGMNFREEKITGNGK